jgi:hypothetical protein
MVEFLRTIQQDLQISPQLPTNGSIQECIRRAIQTLSDELIAAQTTINCQYQTSRKDREDWDNLHQELQETLYKLQKAQDELTAMKSKDQSLEQKLGSLQLQVHDRLRTKISFEAFQINDLVLFLPTRNPTGIIKDH